MAMKPRTIRRVVLVSLIAGVVVLAALGYFVVRPWQSQRQLESMRTQGMAAYERDDYPEAVMLLGRYMRGSDQPEPEVMLAFARARLKVQSSDGGFVVLAMRAYRDYLNREPGDLEAARELLPLFIALDMNAEALALIEMLREGSGEASLDTIRAELSARRSMGQTGEQIEALHRQTAEHPDAGFGDMLSYVAALNRRGAADEAAAFIERRLAADPGSIESKLLHQWQHDWRRVGPSGMTGETAARLVSELSAVVGLDPQSGGWNSQAPDLTGVATFLDRLFNSARRPDLSLRVRLAAAEQGDYLSVVWAARRLYWTNQRDRLQALAVLTEDGEPAPDLVGYQALDHLRSGDADGLAERRRTLGEIELDYRAGAWAAFLDGREMMEDGRLVEARGSLRKALDMHRFEPTFQFAMGDLLYDLGRLSEASEFWERADQMANGGDFDAGQMGVVGWTAPTLRLVSAYFAAERFAEAVPYLARLQNVAEGDAVATDRLFQSYAALAERGILSREDARRLLENFEQLRSNNELVVYYAPYLATLSAYVDQHDQARETIRLALDAGPDERALRLLIDVDRRFGLGVLGGTEIDIERVRAATPNGALRSALDRYEQERSADAGLAVIEGARDLHADEDTALSWDLARARYLDEVGDERALAAFERLRERHPDDIGLLHTIVESRAFRKDLDRVDALIAEIVEKTSTAGQALPARLRLARAQAIADRGAKRSARDAALEIVRSVVASEPSNIRARNMLGRLLEQRPEPGLPEHERFEPDIGGAISQYATIANQIGGREAQRYILQAADLSFNSGDVESARRYLEQFEARFGDDYGSLPDIARRYENIGAADRALSVWSKIAQGSSNGYEQINAQLERADLYFLTNRSAQGRALLEAVSELDRFTSEQLLRLASLYTRAGDETRGREIAQSGQSYGLSDDEARMVYARYAERFDSGDEHLRSLREVVERDPENAAAWEQLVRRLIREGRYEQARDALAGAEPHLEERTARTLEILARGELGSASELIESGAVQGPPEVAEAARRVDAYNRLDPETERATRIALLTGMLEEFPDFHPLQSYALGQLAQAGADARVLARYADAAARRFPDSPQIMGMAGNAYLQSGQPAEAHRIAQLWRANEQGSTVQADAISARAMIQMKNFAESIRLLQPHVPAALETPTLPMSREVLHAHTHAMLMEGEGPESAAERLAPLLGSDANFRIGVFLNLAVGSVPGHEDGAAWIRRVEPYIEDSRRRAVAEAWVALAERHQAWVARYGQSAIDIVGSLPSDMSSAVLLAQAHAIVARAADEPAAEREGFDKAIGVLENAAAKNDNSLLLMQAAQYAMESGRPDRAEELYRAALERGISNDQVRSAVHNNLAMLILRAEGGRDLHEALGHAKRAIELVDRGTFWGTRGWVELAMGNPDAAESSFAQQTRLMPQDPEGWVGLAVAIERRDPERGEQADTAFERAMREAGAAGLSEELRGRLQDIVPERWHARIAP